MKTKSKSINALSAVIRRQIGSISGGLRNSHALLRDVAAVDMSDESVNANARVRTVMQTLVEQNGRVAGVLQQTAQTTQAITTEVSAAVVGMQFQDLAMQRLGNVGGALRALGAALEDMEQRTPGGGLDPAEDGLDREWVERMIAGCTLKEVRTRLTNRILAAGTAEVTFGTASGETAADDGLDGIDLF